MNILKFKLFVLAAFFCTSIAAQQIFPDSWIGNYKGNLEIYGVDNVQMELPMALEIYKKSDTIYQWKITYDFKGKIDVRDYELKVIDKAKGNYLIDEKNDILINAYYKSEIFTSFFEVMDSFIVASYKREFDDIEFEIIASNKKQNSISGGTIIANDSIPKVISYLVNGRQKARLKKVKLPSN
jgi:hypothetical protein